MISELRPCPLCQAEDAREALVTRACSARGEPYAVVACRRCELRYTSPLPTMAELAELYPEAYYGASEPRLLSWETLRRLLHRDVLWQRRRALLGRAPGRILDIGCGDGDFLASLKARGWQVFGAEFSAAACDLARQNGIVVHQGELKSADFPPGWFDVITLWHVLEHLPEPAAELAAIHRLLRDDGLLVVEVPNSASPTFRLLGEHWFPLGVPRHLQHFTPASLGRFLRRGGFAPIRRQDFHHFDCLLTAISAMDALGSIGRISGDHYFVTDFRRASLPSKAAFLALGLPVALLSALWSAYATALTGNGETLTVTARKAPR